MPGASLRRYPPCKLEAKAFRQPRTPGELSARGRTLPFLASLNNLNTNGGNTPPERVHPWDRLRFFLIEPSPDHPVTSL
jgi:hypothetical protein